MVRRGLRWVGYLPPGAMVMFRLGLLPRAMSEPVTLLQPQSVLVCVAPVTIISLDDRAAQSRPHPSLAATIG